MQSVSVRACGAALLLLLVLLPAVPAFASDPPPGPVVLEGRIHTPPGLTAQQEDEFALWDFFLVWLQGRIQPPAG
jgi:hypothetical protein